MMKSCDFTDEAITEALFSPILKEDPKKKAEFLETCRMIREIAKEFEGDFDEAYVSLDVYDGSTDIIVSIGIDEFETIANSTFFKIVKRSKKMLITKDYNNEAIRISFAFDGFWKQN